MINLTKDAPKISLEKAQANTGEMRVNLNWSQPLRKSGFWASLATPASIDLDLGCLYELENGDKGVVQALGNSFGSLDFEPFIQLDADDRSGQSAAGENIFVNMSQISGIKRILFFTFIYEGAPTWDVANGVVTLFPPTGDAITVKLDAADNKPMCAIALVNVSGDTVSVQREVKYFDGHDDMDHAYRWGLHWIPGTKD